MRRADRWLWAAVLLVNGWLALDQAGIAQRLFPDASNRALRAARRAKADEPAAILKREAAIRELRAGAGHPWAGKYRILGQTLTLGPGLGYRQAATGSKWADQGEVRDRGSLLELHSSKPELNRSVRVVRWGERVYLLSDEEFVDFANAYNNGWEPRRTEGGAFFLREGDWSKPAPGLPLVPAAFRAHFLARPLAARILTATSPRRKDRDPFSSLVSRVTLDAGRLKGVFPGMVFYPKEKDRWTEFKILSVAERSSESEVSYFKGESAPMPGWRLTTRDERPPRAISGMCAGAYGSSTGGWMLANGYGIKDAD